MDQVKIGKFIAECRKEKKLTQTQLAEKLCITDRAISKWENGKAMPDSSLMIELSDLLGISVNELLEGEKVKQENYHKVAEENLVKMNQKAEGMQKRMRIFQTIFTTLCLFFSLLTIGLLVIHMAMNYMVPTYGGGLFEAMGPLSIILTFIFTLTSGILTFQEKYVIVFKEGEKRMEKQQKESAEMQEDEAMKKKIQRAEKCCKGLSIGFSIGIVFFLCLHIFYKYIVKWEIEALYDIAGGLGIWAVFFLWIYTFLTDFSRKYIVSKKK